MDALIGSAGTCRFLRGETGYDAELSRLSEAERLLGQALQAAEESNRALVTEAEKADGSEKENHPDAELSDDRDDEIRRQYAGGKKIAAGMSDSERYEMLKDRTISVTAKVDTDKLSAAKAKLDANAENAKELSIGERKKLFKKLGTEFSVFKNYSNSDVKLDFTFSKGNMGESVVKQQDRYGDFAKMLTCFDQVIDSAVGIEVHNRNKDGYKPDKSLANVYVMASAFEDGDRIVPIKLEVKEFTGQKENALYVAVSLQSIKKSEIVNVTNAAYGGQANTSPSLTIKIADFFRKINPADKEFIKYIPPKFLADSSRAALETDSAGASLSDGQQEYFKNSKVRDKNGRLLRVYHGTPRDTFNVFRYSNIGSNGGTQSGYGFYFSPSKKEAGMYSQGIGHIKEGYLNIINPIDGNGKEISGNIEKLVKALPYSMQLDIKNSGYTIDDLISKYGKYNNRDFLAIFPFDFDFWSEAFNASLMRMGYDGVITESEEYPTEYVIFDSNQFKLTTNLNPTENEDIRYSSEEDDQIRREYSYKGKDMAADGEIYSYDFLTHQLPMVSIELVPLSTVKEGRNISRDKAINLGLKNAMEIGEKVSETEASVENRYTKRKIKISKSSLSHSIGGVNANRVRTNARLAASAGEIIQNAIPINGLKTKNPQANSTYAMAYIAGSGDRDIVAIVTVETFTNDVVGIEYVDAVHAISGRLNRTSSRSSTRETGLIPATATRNISVADVIDVVNNTYRSILSIDVLNHYGEIKSADGYYTGETLYSDEADDAIRKESARKRTERQLQQENERLKAKVDTLRQQMRSINVRQFSDADTARVSRALKEEYGSGVKLNALNSAIREVGKAVLNGGNVTEAAEAAARVVLAKNTEKQAMLLHGLFFRG